MALKRKTPKQEKNTNSTVEYQNLPEGEHEGRLVYVGDLGIQAREFKGEAKPPCQQLSLGIEIIDNVVSIDGKDQPRILWTKPFNIFQQLTEMGKELSMYKIFRPNAKEGEVADWDAVLDLPCTVNVIHTEKDGTKYDNIDSLLPIPTKYQSAVGEAKTTDMCVGDSEDENNPATKALFGLARYVHGKRIDSDAPSEKSEDKVELKVVDDDFDDDVPF